MTIDQGMLAQLAASTMDSIEEDVADSRLPDDTRLRTVLLVIEVVGHDGDGDEISAVTIRATSDSHTIRLGLLHRALVAETQEG